MNDSQFDMIFVIIVCVIGAFVVFSIFSSVSKKIQNSSAPILEIPVKIVDKRVQARKGSESHYNVFKITFEDLDTAARHTFSMSEKEFDQIVEDDIGYLKYQRKRFHSFQRDALAAEFEEDTASKSNQQFTIED